ncbi:hypothetical protein BW716_18185 [[Flexibacter] sp. ATCC 35208]|nr:hypothetical protein BW716_18185 [[Flexibacter] sp. ATCC 35208]
MTLRKTGRMLTGFFNSLNTLQVEYYIQIKLYIMKKKEIKELKEKLIVSVKKTLTANNKGLINTLEKDLDKSIKAFSVRHTQKT